MYKYLFNFPKSRGHLFRWSIHCTPHLSYLLPLPAPHPWPCNPCCQLKCRTMDFGWIFSGDQQTRFVKIRNRNYVPKAFSLGTLLSERQVLTAEKGNVNSGNHVIPCLWSNLTLPLNSKCPNQASKCPNQAGKPWRSAKRVFLDKVLKHAKAAYIHLHSQYWIISPSFYIINILYNTLCFSICWQLSFHTANDSKERISIVQVASNFSLFYGSDSERSVFYYQFYCQFLNEKDDPFLIKKYDQFLIKKDLLLAFALL